jgi:predicted nucleic acid-binding protein
MRFWDASAIVPLIVSENESANCRRILAQDTELIVWCLTPVEVTSALARRLRENSLSLALFRGAKNQLSVLERGWSEVISFEAVHDRARRLLEVHPLRAADSLQLAAALVASEEKPSQLPFISLDGNLARAAEKEGFELIEV